MSSVDRTGSISPCANTILSVVRVQIDGVLDAVFVVFTLGFDPKCMAMGIRTRSLAKLGFPLNHQFIKCAYSHSESLYVSLDLNDSEQPRSYDHGDDEYREHPVRDSVVVSVFVFVMLSGD